MDTGNTHPSAGDVSPFPAILYVQPNQKDDSQAVLCHVHSCRKKIIMIVKSYSSYATQGKVLVWWVEGG